MAFFTYNGKETTIVANLLKSYNVKVAFKTSNSLQKHLCLKQYFTDKQNKSWIYNLNIMIALDVTLNRHDICFK